ncbi:hypothetical protein BB561_006042 [Smittium simulii]|uniref:Glycerol-3-phosphate dehydrogenase [NAD(+)] n=1 Tax=Smittium simulii TaxID=133385 RepID=A0A2T9Y6Y5_9FUNG|nr:hypothetical protein BB561_006042 [Smittium simulii]
MEKVCIYGSGNWGTTAAKIIGENIPKFSGFHQTVNMFVHPEKFNGTELTELINTTNENPKYLPGHKLTSNIHATSDLREALDGVTMLVVVIPHQFLPSSMKAVAALIDTSKLKVISLIKGMYIAKDSIQTTTQAIEAILKVKPSVLSGANIASEIAGHQICESTLGCAFKSESDLWYNLFQTDYFNIQCVTDVYGVELYGALKNVVAVGVGIAEGTGVGNNSKAAILRLGLLEMKKFTLHLFPDTPNDIILQSCGVADLVTSCMGGRNYKLGVEFSKTKKSFDQLEEELLGGQKLQGPATAHEIYLYNKNHNLTEEFPLFTIIYQICYESRDTHDIFKTLHGLRL